MIPTTHSPSILSQLTQGCTSMNNFPPSLPAALLNSPSPPGWKGRLPFPAVHLLEHGWRHAHERIHTCQILARALQIGPIKRGVTWRELYFSSRIWRFDCRS
ncbi:unnamed protein product [Periconia digitata]|uniref:Uncharacterized protein n=1 Tax=Periconia digitata TaxID=1303443 RepID=A0A9W4XPC4_9PLEO|nr:unnamed protein product [Periconia digitata]